MTLDFFLSGVLQGLVLAFVAYGMMIPFRLLRFSDLTAEGAYPLSGAVCATLISWKWPWAGAISLSILASGILSVSTAFLYLKFRIETLLAGIILSIMSYSVSLRIMGKPNIPLFAQTSLFYEDLLVNIALLLGLLLLCIVPFYFFLKTDFGLSFRAVGLNAVFAARQSLPVARYIYLGFFLSGCFLGLAGSLMVQLQHYMDISMGTGIVIHGLASLMIGESLVSQKTLKGQFLAPLLGSFVYQQIQGMALMAGLAASDLKFFTGALVLCVISWQYKKIK
ncbi:MAG: ABC transporter permease [Alphaproteobacteria bacterium 40-19]|nr:MAG: ABC transporter permease [Alphaproteobacteria bacterium 40-19]